MLATRSRTRCLILHGGIPEMSGTDLSLLLIGVFTFLLVALAVDLGISWWRANRSEPARRVRSRIERMSSSDHDPLESSESDDSQVLQGKVYSRNAKLNSVLGTVPRIDEVDRWLRQSGSNWTVGKLIFLSLAALLGSLMLTVLIGVDAVLAIPLAVILGSLPSLSIKQRRSNRLKRFDAQLPDALEVLSRAMRAGYSMPAAMKVVAEDMPDPIGAEFRMAHDQITFGASPQVALSNLTQRVPSSDLKFMTIATLIQRETGGNLAEVLNKIAQLMRERSTLAGQIRVLSADGRISGIILFLLPFITVLMAYLLNPTYIQKLWTTEPGHKMLWVSAGMMTVGVFWMRRVIRINF